MKLYSFATSSASYRVRIALHLKNVAFDTVTIHLPKAEQRQPAYRRINPHGRVPALELDDGTVIGQSLAIVDYLELAHRQPAIFPSDPVMRARALSVALTIAADIHPLNNSSVLDYLRDTCGRDQAARDVWYGHWIRAGFASVEQLIDPGPYCFGSEPTIADICLVPQVFNARRFNVDISDFPKIVAVDAVASAHPAFVNASPAAQPAVA